MHGTVDALEPFAAGCVAKTVAGISEYAVNGLLGSHVCEPTLPTAAADLPVTFLQHYGTKRHRRFFGFAA